MEIFFCYNYSVFVAHLLDFAIICGLCGGLLCSFRPKNERDSTEKVVSILNFAKVILLIIMYGVIFLQKSCSNIWQIERKVLPLHSQMKAM